MKIALVAVEIHKHGGVPLCVAYLLEHLRKNHSITIFCDKIADIDTKGLSVYRIPLPAWPRFLRPIVFIVVFNLVFLWLRIFKKTEFDIVHSAGEEGALAANVVTTHFCQRKELDALHQGAVKLPTGTWRQKLRALDYYINRRLACFLEWSVFGRANPRLRTAVSKKMKEDLVRYYGGPAKDTVVIPNGVDIEEFDPGLQSEWRSKIRRETGFSDNDFLLFFIGGDWERKGVPQAIEALSLVADRSVKLLVVGMGDEFHYKSMAARLGVGDRVVFITRFVKQAHYYAASDVFLFPTLYEPFGLVILEAMATEIPVITSAIAGASDYIEDGVDSLLAQNPRNARELADKIELLVKNPELRRSIGQNALRKARSMSWQAITNIYENAYLKHIRDFKNIAEQ